MDWKEVKIYASSAGIEVLTGILSDLNIGGYVIEDANDFEGFLASNDTYYDYIDERLYEIKSIKSNIKLYLPENGQGKNALENVENRLDLLKESNLENLYGSLDISVSVVSDSDWENGWKKYFKPISIGKHLIIKPSWEECEAVLGRRILTIDPSMSFGTGQHESTRLCLELLEEKLKTGDCVLDLGCGSGILSIAAMLLGAKSALAVDIDENSTKTAKKNAYENGFSEGNYSVYTGDITKDEELRIKLGYKRYDIILANIVSDVIINMGKYFSSFLKPDGRLIVSGIITERAFEVLNVLNQYGFSTTDTFEDNGWTAFCLARK